MALNQAIVSRAGAAVTAVSFTGKPRHQPHAQASNESLILVCFCFPELVQRRSLTIIPEIILPDYQVDQLTTLSFNVSGVVFSFIYLFLHWGCPELQIAHVLKCMNTKTREVNKLHKMNKTSLVWLNIQTPLICTGSRLFFRQTTCKA